MELFQYILICILTIVLQAGVFAIRDAQKELVALKAHYAKMECVEVFDYPFENKQSGKK